MYLYNIIKKNLEIGLAITIRVSSSISKSLEMDVHITI